MADMELSEEKAVSPLTILKRTERTSSRKKARRLIYLILAVVLVGALSIFIVTKNKRPATTVPHISVKTKEQAVKLFNQGDFKKAIPKLEAYTKANPDDIEAEAVLGQSYWLRGDYRAAYRRYQEIIKIKPDDADAHYRLGILAGLLKKNNKAAKELRRAVELKPQTRIYQVELAKALARAGRLNEAVARWRQVLALTPPADKSGRADVYAEIGNLYLKEKKAAEAATAYKEGLKIDAGNEYLRSQLDKVK